MKRLFWLFLAIVASTMPTARGGDLGIVLMHGGKGDAGAKDFIVGLAVDLRRAGYEVVTPTMPWGAGRLYDRTVEGAMQEIDAEVASLRQKGFARVVVAGQSFGANAALRYGAARGGIAGIMALSPGHVPDLWADVLRDDIAKARDMIAAGKGQETARLRDINQGRQQIVVTTAENYLSWLDPDGKAVMPKSAASFAAPIPLLVVIGRWDSRARGREYVFDKAPAHPNSKFVVVTADHLTVPSAATDEILSWLAALPK